MSVAFLHQQISLKHFYVTSRRILPWIILFSIVLISYGLVGGLFLSPPDYQQGDGFRIIYVHVPSSFMSLLIYSLMGVHSIIFLIWRIKLADIIAEASSLIGATFTLMALITGAIWGKPMWGTWWVWDARLTSELILLFLYVGYMGLRSSSLDWRIASKRCAILAIIGLVDIPIIHFSVEWWHTLHQGATLAKFAKPSIDTLMLYPLISMIIGFFFFYISIVLIRVRAIILYRERHTEWASNIVKNEFS